MTSSNAYDAMYRPELWKPARDIKVSRFRQILTWPLALTSKSIDRAGEDALHRAMAQVHQSVAWCDHWRQIGDLADHAWNPDLKASRECQARDAETAFGYAERVYFHDFIQRNLFGKTSTDAPKPISLFQRRGCFQLEAVLKQGGRHLRYSFTVDRINLYLFSSGAAMLAMEVSTDNSPHVCLLDAPEDGVVSRRAMTLADVQLACDHMRRVYPPFFGPDGDHQARLPSSLWPANRVPVAMKLFPGEKGKAAGPAIASLDASEALLSPRGAEGHWRENRVPGVFDFWNALVSPLRIEGMPPREPSRRSPRHVFRQVVDERVPIMSFIALEKTDRSKPDAAPLLRISRGDWVRLCFADAPGNHRHYPYAPHMLETFERDHCYDRYFPHPDAPFGASRILNSGYHFAFIGCGDFFENTLQEHFRRHYFQIGLAVHMEIGSLLSASAQVADAVEKLIEAGRDEAARQRFERAMQAIERDFLEYVHLFRFTGMSNQLQPGEMLAQWRARLNTAALYEDVRTEIDTANQFLMATEQSRQTQAAARLNIIAILGVVLGLAFSFLGMNVLITGDRLEDGMAGFAGLAARHHWMWFGGTLLGFGAGGLALATILAPGRPGTGTPDGLVKLLLGAVALAGGLALLFAPAP